jgi:hypothetical protein
VLVVLVVLVVRATFDDELELPPHPANASAASTGRQIRLLVRISVTLLG